MPEAVPATSRDVADLLKAKGLPANFCPIPFSTLLFEAQGKVCLCRQKGNEFAVGNIQTQTLEEIWNGPFIRAIREEFLSGKVVTCAREIARDSCNVLVDHLEILKSAELAAVQTRLPIRISPNFNGRCNLECPMCHVWQQPNGLYDGIGFWERLENEILPHLIEIDSFSGEPFIQRDTYRLIDLAVRVNPAIRWSFTTNGNWRFNGKIRGYLDRLELKNFNFSIDSLDADVYAKIRKGGRLELALETLDRVAGYLDAREAAGRGRVAVSMNFMLQNDNWRELPAVFRFIRDKGIQLCLYTLVEPVQFSLLERPNRDKAAILDYLLAEVLPGDLVLATRAIRPLLESLPPIEKAAFLSRYREIMGALSA